MSDQTFDVVATFLTRVDADLAKTALEAAGIDATVSADDASGMRPHLWMGGVRLLVATGDLARARDVLAVTDQPLADEAAPES
jgi:Putative prokaryotic signal transducing protein